MKKLITGIFALIGIAATLAFIGLEIYVWLTYGKAPADEIPVWALYLLFRN